MSAPPSPILTANHVPLGAARQAPSLVDYTAIAGRAWLDANKHAAIPPYPGVAEVGDPIDPAVPYSTGGGGPVANAVSILPWVVAPDMPQESVARYIHFWIRATYAALLVQSPHLAGAFSNGAAAYTVIPAVGVRVGMIAALGMPPDAGKGEFSRALYYDSKRQCLWLRGATDGEGTVLTSWRAALAATPDPDATAVEIALAWAHVAPMLASMSSAENYAIGNSYSVPFAQRAIADHMSAVLSAEKVRHAMLSRPVTWDTAAQASIEGYPSSWVLAWAADPILAVCAERRILVEVRDIAANKARETQARTRLAAIAPSRARVSAGPKRHEIWRALRTDMPDQWEVGSMATALAVDAELKPDDSASHISARRPISILSGQYRAPELPQAQKDRIATLMRNSRAADADVPSALYGAESDAPVKW